MLHPVGHLPPAVYWRRRLLVLALVVAVLGGGTWLSVELFRGDGSAAAAGAAAEAASEQPAEPPALDLVVPSVSGVQTPTPAPDVPEPAPEPAAPAGPEPGGPCTDDVLALEVRTPGSAPAGGKPTFELVVTNTAAVPCVRALDMELQEIVLLDTAGNRLWGSNDCFPESSDDLRTLQPGESAAFPLVWGGLTSEPGCAGDRTTPAPGEYVLRGRLDTKTSADAPFVVT